MSIIEQKNFFQKYRSFIDRMKENCKVIKAFLEQSCPKYVFHV